MFVVIGLMLSGVALGYLLRGKIGFGWASKAISLAIFALLFLLGVSVGINRQIMDNLATLGVEALVITIGALAGSLFFAWLIYRYFFASKKKI